MKKELFRFTLYVIIVYLTNGTLSPAIAATQPSGGNGTHFCGVSHYQPRWYRDSKQQDNRNYARRFAANLNVGAPRTVYISDPVPPSLTVRDAFNLDPFYQQWIDVEGLPVLGSEKVNPYALKEAAWLIWQMIGHRPDVIEVWVQNRVRYSVMAYNEILTDIPEFSANHIDFLVFRTRGEAGTAIPEPTVTSAEENLLGDGSYSILIHEFGHAVHLHGLKLIDPTFDDRLQRAYDTAMANGLWQGTYASSNSWEYWAEGTQAWFYPNGGGSFNNYGNTRQALKAYDPGLAALLTEIYGDGDWRYTIPATRTHLPHLQGFNPQDVPTFQPPVEVVQLYEQFRNPNSDGGGKWVDLRPYDPSLLLSLNESRTVGKDTMITFMNFTQTDILLYWVSWDGTENFWKRVPPHETQWTPTRAGSIYLIKDSLGKNLAVFQAVAKTGRALIVPSLALITPGLSKISGDNQTGVSRTALANPFVVEVRDEGLSVLEGISVTFTVTTGDGTLSVMHTTTDENGRAESTFTLGPNLGTNTVSVSATGIAQPVIFTAVAEAAVAIPDSNLRAAVETALGKVPADTITASETETLTRLQAPNADIRDLTGLELATNLTRLNLGGESVGSEYVNSNTISDLSPLAGLTNLTQLDLWGNNISDISALASLTNLAGLWLGVNSISDISVVADLTHLINLGLEGNNISDISAVAGLTNLNWLNLGANSILDVSVVANLANLTWLNLGSNNVFDVSALAGLTQLKMLYLWDNSISDLSPVEGLTDLTFLLLRDNRITDISALVANMGLGSGDTVDVRANPLSYQSIHTHIPTLQQRGVTVEFNNRTPAPPLKISGDDQQAAPGTTLEHPFVVEVRDQNGEVFAGVPVTFAITAGGGTLSVTNTIADANGRAQSILTLGPNPETNTISVSATRIAGSVTFHAISDIPFIEYILSIPAGTSLIHVPLRVTAVDKIEKIIESVGDLYDALGGASVVNFLITYDSATQGWLSYFVPSDKGSSADAALTDDKGIIVGLRTPVSIQLRGNPLGTDGNSAITLTPGINLVGLPLRDSRVRRVSHLFALDGIGGNVPVIILTDNGEFKAVGRADDPGDIAITGGQAFIMTAQREAMVTISGDGWYNVSEVAAGPPLSLKSIEVGHTTPVLGVRGSIIDEGTGVNNAGLRVRVKNLSTGRAVAAVAKDVQPSRTDKREPAGVGYQVTIVDVETGRAARIGDILEVSVRSPDPFIGVQPLQYTVTAEDVRQSLIQLSALVAYEIPVETELLHNYPNPFNPETWIPYRLAEDAFVTLTIYDGAGHLVRTLEVGHRIAAVYESRSKTIYWDGRNRLGEQVASGVYFYHLSAGDYSATRKMLVMK